MLAAGTGTRLRPLTWEQPKALCPVNGVPLVDLALGGLGRLGLGAGELAVNAHHFAGSLAAHLEGRAHVSLEPALLGTGGALGRLRGWIGGRAVVVVNADTVHDLSLTAVLEGWDGERIRFLASGAAATETVTSRPFDRLRLAGVAMPWAAVRTLPDQPCSVSEVLWAPWADAGRVEVVRAAGPFFDCGTPAAYLAANLWRSGGETVVGAGAMVAGQAERCVIWPGAVVAVGEHLARRDPHDGRPHSARPRARRVTARSALSA